jgi:BetI-type transcriptional repressor, C-terminal
MNFLIEMEGEPTSSWLLWLDLWAQSVRLPEVASVRQKFDERWREMIISVVLAGQAAGEFGPVNAEDFAVTLTALLDGLAIQIALTDPSVDSGRAFELGMQFASGQLGFEWAGRSPGR